MQLSKRTFKIIISSSVALVVVSLFSVGFATWSVMEGDQLNVEDGKIVVESVDASNVNKFENVPTVSNAICFGHPEDTSIYGFTDPWLNVNGNKVENLTCYIDAQITGLTIDNYDKILVVDDLVESSGKYATAVSEGLVGALPAAVISYVGDNTARVTFTFTWGTAFNNKNPYEFYNSQPQSFALEVDASEKLSSLKTLLDGVNYSVKLSTK